MNLPSQISNLRVVEMASYEVVCIVCTTNFLEMPLNTKIIWQKLQTQSKPFKNRQLISIQHYPKGYFENFNPHTLFNKMAAIKLAEYVSLIQEAQTTSIAGGKFVTFNYQGNLLQFGEALRFVLSEWIPTNLFAIDYNRYFAEWLDADYAMNKTINKETVYIPVKTIN